MSARQASTGHHLPALFYKTEMKSTRWLLFKYVGCELSHSPSLSKGEQLLSALAPSSPLDEQRTLAISVFPSNG